VFEIVCGRGRVIEPLEKVAKWEEALIESSHYCWVGGFGTC